MDSRAEALQEEKDKRLNGIRGDASKLFAGNSLQTWIACCLLEVNLTNVYLEFGARAKREEKEHAFLFFFAVPIPRAGTMSGDGARANLVKSLGKRESHFPFVIILYSYKLIQ